MNFAPVLVQNPHTDRRQRPIYRPKQFDHARDAPSVGWHFANDIRDSIKELDTILDGYKP